MSATREAVVLPTIFLTVALLGGLRVGETVRLLPPPLIALVLGMILLGTLARAGALSPDRLMNAERTALENISGLIVLVSLFAGSAQVFNLVTPERGLLHAAFGICLFVQLVTTLAGVTGRSSVLRSLLVLLAAAFVMRFVVLESMYSADGGLLKRVVTTLLEGVSLGTMEYQPNAAATGYVAFFTIVLYMIGLALLPPATGKKHSHARDLRPAAGADLVVLLIATGLTLTACGGGVSARGARPEAAGAHQAAIEHAESRVAIREEALRAARVWHAPSRPVSEVDFAANPSAPGGFLPSDDIACRFIVRRMGGTTPKFHCELPDGRIVKVKYGANPELHAEVAATRLLDALGFGADRMYVVRSVECAGCPRFPFQALKCYAATGMDRVCFAGGVDYAEITTFTTAVVERQMEGSVIEAAEDTGWAWFELDRVDPARGGSSRAEVDALRLLAVVLAHWDNKAPNQRLICPPGGELPGGRCSAPLAIVQDLGATFGPSKLDLPNWRMTPVWADRVTCTVSMQTMPFHGATFPDRQISEEGRLLLAGLLEQLTDEQLTDLFTASRVVSFDQVSAEARGPAAWVKAFRDKVRQVRDGTPCPQ